MTLDPQDDPPDRLPRRERTLSEVLAVIREPVCVTDADLRFLYANPAAEAYMGRTAAEVLGRTMGELFPEFAGSPLERHLRRVRDEGAPTRFEIESRLHPGTFYEVHVQPNADGLILYYRDVTARRLDAEALATRDRLMRVAQGMAHVGSWIVEGPEDLATARVTWSDETFRIFGYRPHAATPSVALFFQHCVPADRPRVEQAVARALEAGQPYEVENRIVRPDGSQRVVHQWGVVERTADGRPLRVLGACQDVTEAREREQAVRDAREQLQFVTDTMVAQVAHCSRDMRYVWVSRAYAAARGLTPEQVAGRPIEDVLGAEVTASIRPHIERVLRGERFSFEQEIRYLDRGPTWLEVHYEPTFDPDGRPDGWVALVVDIDARRRAEEALREADRRKNEFLAVLAHELRNPLAPIRNAVHLLALAAPNEPRLAGPLGLIERQVGHMARLLDDLLDVGRITAGRILLRREPVNLAEVVRSAAEDLRGLLEKSRLRLAISVPDEPLLVAGDPTRLAQIVGNLLQNAAKFGQPGGHVVVRAEREGDAGALVSVADDGVGIAPDVLPRLFEPFSQGERPHGGRGGGLGLGLALVRRLAELHGGTVRAHSAGLGAGAEFQVRLPLGDARPAAATAAPARPSRPRKVMVVDDNPDVAESVRLLLEAFGHEVSVAESGERALEVARDRAPEIVVCDLGLPGMDGYAVARALRESANGSLRLIALSGYGQAEDKARAAAAGFDLHLTKPLDPLRLRALIDELG
jgi:PAS domain S-box-containing protein